MERERKKNKTEIKWRLKELTLAEDKEITSAKGGKEQCRKYIKNKLFLLKQKLKKLKD